MIKILFLALRSCSSGQRLPRRMGQRHLIVQLEGHLQDTFFYISGCLPRLHLTTDLPGPTLNEAYWVCLKWGLRRCSWRGLLATLICPNVENHKTVSWSKSTDAHSLLSTARIFKGRALAEILSSFDKHLSVHPGLTSIALGAQRRRSH